MELKLCIKYYIFHTLSLWIITMLISCKVEGYNPTFPKEKQIAHRGYWNAGAPENSLQAVQYAIDAGLYGAEIDIHETKDGTVVVNHDDTYEGINIRSSSYQDILNNTNADIPLFSDFLILIQKYPKFKLIVEIKTAYNIKSIIKLTEQYGVSSQIEFISFNKNYCEDIIQVNPEYKVGYLGYDLSPQYLADKGYDIINSSYNFFISNPEIISEAYSLGLQVYTWTVNDAHLMSRMYNMGILRITTDYPRYNNSDKI